MNGGWHWVSCLEKRPTWRGAEDIDIIFSKLKTMKAFEHYPEPVLLELSRYVLYDTFLSNVTLFRPGEDSIYWYAVVTGTLEMMDVDANDSSKTTSICQLRDGDSFGENVIFGTSRQTMIVTTEYCELLYVEAENMRQIYEAHKDIMERLLRLNSFEQQASLSETDGNERDEYVEDSDLLVAGVTLHQLIKDHFSELFADHKVNLFTYRGSCSGRKLVDWVLAQSSTPRTRQQVIQMWQALLAEGVIQHVHKEHPFRDEPSLFYQFVERRVKQNAKSPRRWSSAVQDSAGGMLNGRPRSLSSVASSPRSSRSSVSSILDECFDTIASLGPEALIFATLRKSQEERNSEDIELIYDELLHVRAFRHLSNAVKKEIAACVKLEHFKQAGKYLFRQGDKGDSWYIILKGSVNVIIRGKGVVCTLHEGDEFGKLAVVNEAVRSATVQVREDNSYFLRIEREDFRRILLSVESTTMKFLEHGREVLLLEKASLGRYLVVKGTPDKMLDHLLDSEIEEGSQEDSFARDFFLTYPAFITTGDLCEGFKKRYHHEVPRTPSLESHAISAGDQEKLKKRRIAEAVCIWINTTKAELVKDPVFQLMLRELQDNLTKDGLQEQLSSINVSLADSIRGAQVNNSPTPFSFAVFKHRKVSSVPQDHEIKMGVCILPPCQPQDKISLRVHTVDHTCCRLQVRLDMRARDIAREACEKLGLPADKYRLCEVKSSGEKKELRDSDISVHSEMSVNGRLYIVQRSHSDRILPPLPDQNQKPVTPFPDKDSSKEIAAHLALYDWNLFSNIQQMEFIYQLFGRHKFGKITTNLDLLIRRFNEVQFWVVTEICREQDLVKRVALVKKFIKIAGYCKSFNDLNSFFAVTIGLMNGAITRLKLTWKEVPLKAKRRLNQFESLTDPSRNHKVLRAYQSKLAPPITPFMPLVMKDAFFLHEGNETYVNDLVNFEKMRLVASKVRGLNVFRSVGLPADIKVLANKNPALQQYFRGLKVIDNVQLLTQMSHKVEPSSSASSAAAGTDRPLSSVS